MTSEDYLGFPSGDKEYTRCPYYHVWEAFSWGIIIGVSRCKKCGAVSRETDFNRPRAYRDDDQ